MKKALGFTLISFAMIVLSTYLWHWSIGVRVGENCLRIEAQRGEGAISLWRGNPNYRMDAPMFFAHPADSRTRLSDSAVEFVAGVGWMRGAPQWLGGSKTLGFVAPWWHWLLGVLSLLGMVGIARLAWRKLRSRKQTG